MQGTRPQRFSFTSDLRQLGGDFFFVHCSDKEFILVELKGNDLQQSYDQIVSTKTLLNGIAFPIPKENLHARIVTSGNVNVPLISWRRLQDKFIKEHGKTIERATNKYELSRLTI